MFGTLNHVVENRSAILKPNENQNQNNELGKMEYIDNIKSIKSIMFAHLEWQKCASSNFIKIVCASQRREPQNNKLNVSLQTGSDISKVLLNGAI